MTCHGAITPPVNPFKEQLLILIDDLTKAKSLLMALVPYPGLSKAEVRELATRLGEVSYTIRKLQESAKADLERDGK